MAEIFVAVDGQPVPIEDCSWFSYSPCGCCSGVMIAASGSEAYVTEEQAWVGMEPNMALRKRDRERGVRMKIGLRKDVKTLLATDCPHDPKWGVTLPPKPAGYVWATTMVYPSARERAHLVPVGTATLHTPTAKHPPGHEATTLCGRTEYRWWTSSRTLLDAVECARCVRAAVKLGGVT